MGGRMNNHLINTITALLSVVGLVVVFIDLVFWNIFTFTQAGIIAGLFIAAIGLSIRLERN